MRTLVCIESPYKGKELRRNKAYLGRAMRSSLLSGEAPFASHGLYTIPNCLKDNKPEERALGIQAGLDFAACCDMTVVYADYGISDGMHEGLLYARSKGRPIVWRFIGKNDAPLDSWVQIPDSKITKELVDAFIN